MGRRRRRHGPADKMTNELLLWKKVAEPRRSAKEELLAPSESRPVWVSNALKALVDSLACLERPLVLDLGRVCGDNISFLGALGCRVYAHDLLRDYQEAAEKAPPASPEKEGEESEADPWKRVLDGLDYAPGSLHGVLCWDILDMLPQTWARELVRRISRMLAVGGFILSFFGSNRACKEGVRVGFRILDRDRLEPIPDVTSHPGRRFYQNGEIMRIFSEFSILNFYLMRNSYREVLVQKRTTAYILARTGRGVLPSFS
ncbi:MAG: class I SAM-dependent methyltransferase [Nitrospinota bacterium]